MLQAGAVGHNHLRFYPDAIDVALKRGDRDGALRYAAALEAFTRPEPLLWATFFVARGRALAALGQGRRDERTLEELRRLRTEGERLGLVLALPAVDAALAA